MGNVSQRVSFPLISKNLEILRQRFNEAFTLSCQEIPHQQEEAHLIDTKDYL